MDISKPKSLKVVETILADYEFTQYALWKKTGISFAQVNKVVNYLKEKNAVTKTSNGKYQIAAYIGILQLFSAYRTFPKPTATYQLLGEPQDALAYLAEHGCTFCLTTAWQHYDDYLHDGAIHAYLPKDAAKQKSIITELSAQPKGLQPIYLYNQDLPIETVKVANNVFPKPTTKEPFESHAEPLAKLPVTMPTRTLLDMYTSHYAYGVQQWIANQVKKWHQE
jgi:hypothetical protein